MPRSSRTTENDYQSRYFGRLEQQVDDLENQIKDHDKQLIRHDHQISDNTDKVNVLWKDRYNPPAKKKEDLPPFWDDPRVRTGFKWLAFTLLICAAAAVGINFTEIKGLL